MNNLGVKLQITLTENVAQFLRMLGRRLVIHFVQELADFIFVARRDLVQNFAHRVHPESSAGFLTEERRPPTCFPQAYSAIGNEHADPLDTAFFRSCSTSSQDSRLPIPPSCGECSSKTEEPEGQGRLGSIDRNHLRLICADKSRARAFFLGPGVF